MKSLAYTRWNPKSRAGAIAVRKDRTHDLDAVEALSQHVSQWARYQDLDGEHDSVETSPITGVYDWRAYIQEETHLARQREQQAKPRDKKPERVAAAPAPAVFYQ